LSTSLLDVLALLKSIVLLDENVGLFGVLRNLFEDEGFLDIEGLCAGVDLLELFFTGGLLPDLLLELDPLLFKKPKRLPADCFFVDGVLLLNVTLWLEPLLLDATPPEACFCFAALLAALFAADLAFKLSTSFALSAPARAVILSQL